VPCGTGENWPRVLHEASGTKLDIPSGIVERTPFERATRESFPVDVNGFVSEGFVGDGFEGGDRRSFELSYEGTNLGIHLSSPQQQRSGIVVPKTEFVKRHTEQRLIPHR
jgi:hypothetical protein